MKRAILSDVHANSDALRAVLDDIERRGIEDVICLGDVVGYGPEPGEVIQLVRDRCRVSLMGNHDYALLTVPYGFNPVAAQAIRCNRSQLGMNLARDGALADGGSSVSPAGGDSAAARFPGGCMDHRRCSDHLEWLKERPMKLEEDGVLYVHASPRDPLTEYVLQSDVAYGPNDKIIGIFEKIDGPCFCGHSHRPGVITSDFRWLSTAEANGLDVTRGKYVINEGSVGQPRDGDPRACYVEWDDGTIAFHRVEYPFRKTMKKIEAGGCLHSYCAERLAEGR